MLLVTHFQMEHGQVGELISTLSIRATNTGILDAINKGKVDTGSLFYLNYDRLNDNFAVTNPCVYLSNYIIAPADHGDPLGASLLLVNVFDIPVWIMCIIACVVSVVPAMLMSNYLLFEWRHEKRYSTVAMFCFNNNLDPNIGSPHLRVTEISQISPVQSEH